MASLEEIKKSTKPFFIGADEVGYGSLAGPLVVVGVKAPKDWSMAGLNDSKKLTPEKREALRGKLNELIVKKEIEWHLAERSNVYIDKFGVYNVLKECYVEIFHKLYSDDSLIITDGNLKFDNLGVEAYDKMSLIKGDSHIQQIMAASILAKTYRDEKMRIFHPLHPHYGWDKNVGYWHKDHVAAIEKYGPSPLHRWSYDPLKSMNLPNPNQLELFSDEQRESSKKDGI
jgi:ribonuclease HII